MTTTVSCSVGSRIAAASGHERDRQRQEGDARAHRESSDLDSCALRDRRSDARVATDLVRRPGGDEARRRARRPCRRRAHEPEVVLHDEDPEPVRAEPPEQAGEPSEVAGAAPADGSSTRSTLRRSPRRGDMRRRWSADRSRPVRRPPGLPPDQSSAAEGARADVRRASRGPRARDQRAERPSVAPSQRRPTSGVLEDCQVREDCAALQGPHRPRRARSRSRPRSPRPRQRHPARVGRDRATEQSQRRRLPRAVGPTARRSPPRTTRSSGAARPRPRNASRGRRFDAEAYGCA